MNIVITGASQGIGYATAVELAKMGVIPLYVYREMRQS